jgi:hypothetical protein
MTDQLWHIVLINSLPEGGVAIDPHYVHCRDQYEADQFIKAHKTTRTYSVFSGPMAPQEIKPRRKQSKALQKMQFYR